MKQTTGILRLRTVCSLNSCDLPTVCDRSICVSLKQVAFVSQFFKIFVERMLDSERESSQHFLVFFNESKEQTKLVLESIITLITIWLQTFANVIPSTPSECWRTSSGEFISFWINKLRIIEIRRGNAKFLPHLQTTFPFPLLNLFSLHINLFVRVKNRLHIFFVGLFVCTAASISSIC